MPDTNGFLCNCMGIRVPCTYCDFTFCEMYIVESDEILSKCAEDEGAVLCVCVCVCVCVASCEIMRAN